MSKFKEDELILIENSIFIELLKFKNWCKKNNISESKMKDILLEDILYSVGFNF